MEVNLVIIYRINTSESTQEVLENNGFQEVEDDIWERNGDLFFEEIYEEPEENPVDDLDIILLSRMERKKS